ncbi:MAG: hypothetical protein ACTSQJ_10035 [Promethearchaeota archaeon]
MIREDSKLIIVNIRDLSFKSEQIVVDLIRYLAEQLPQLEITRNGYELELLTPKKLSKRAIRLRIRKFLYKKMLHADYRPISYREITKDGLKDGYIVKEKKVLELAYY